MDHFRVLRASGLAIATALLVLPQTAIAQQPKRHPGRVVELATNRPLAIDVKAWPESRETGRQGDCPLFGTSPLDSTQSKGGDGQFQLRISEKSPTYTATYCAADYHPRADRDLRNE